MPGPWPKAPQERRRRNSASPTVQLPAEGRKGPFPSWPLSTPSPAERGLWARLWRTPQATYWERLGWTRTIARYARLAARAESSPVSAALLAEVRQLEDRFGLTPWAMARLRWEVVEDEVGETRVAKPAPETRRLRAVDLTDVDRRTTR